MHRPFDTRVSHIARWIAETGKRVLPDRAQARRFLRLLDPDAALFSFRTFSDTPYTRIPGSDPLERAIHGSLERCWAELTALNRAGAAICVTINATNGHGRRPRDVTRVRALFVDDDDPGSRAVLLSPPPDITVESSPGRYHHFWLVRDLVLEEFVPAQVRLANRYGTDRKVCSPNQAMALPGFWRRKSVGVVHQTRLLPVRRDVPREGAALVEAGFGA